MPYRQVIRAKKFGGQFAAHTRQHAARVARSATEPFRDRLAPGRKYLDLEEYQVAVGDELDRLAGPRASVEKLDQPALGDPRKAPLAALDPPAPRIAVPAALHRKQQVTFPSERDGFAYVGCPHGLHDECRMPVDATIQDTTCNVIARVTRHQQIASQTVG